MREIKLLLSAKLCAVTVFASCRSKNVRQRFPTAAIAATYKCPRWGQGRRPTITAMCVEIADSSLRNAPRSVSRALTSFRDDCKEKGREYKPTNNLHKKSHLERSGFL